MGDLKNEAELYLSFALVFQRPQLEIARNLEEFIDLWKEELTIPSEDYHKLLDFCRENPSGEARVNALWEHYIPLFEAGTVEAPPYASVYLDNEAQVMGRETFAVKVFYERSGYGLEERSEHLPDHLAVELEFMALMARDEKTELLQEFRVNHLLPFLSRILPHIIHSRRPFYSIAARILNDWQV